MGTDKVARHSCHSSASASVVCRSAGRSCTSLAMCLDSVQRVWTVGRYRILAHVGPLLVYFGRRWRSV